MNAKWLTISISIVALLGGLVSYHVLAPLRAEPVLVSKFTLPDLRGIEHNSSEWRGRVLLINFWATWCPPCLKEIPDFVELQTEYGDRGLQIVGIAVDDQLPVVEFVKQNSINYPILLGLDRGAKLSVTLGNLVQALPYSVVVDRQGQIIYTHRGLFSKQQVIKIITPLLAPPI